MTHLLTHLIDALREELKQYGEILALLDQQQDLVMQRQTNDLLQSISCINAQAAVIAAARHEREQRQRRIARSLKLPEDAGFSVITPRLPADYRPLVQALVQENNELLVRVQQRTRQNHLLLSHAADLMQHLINSIFSGTSPLTGGNAAAGPAAKLPQPPLYGAVR